MGNSELGSCISKTQIYSHKDIHMKFLFCFLIFSVIVAAPIRAILKNPAPFGMKLKESRICKREDIKFCGTYISECEDDGDISAQYTEIVTGDLYSIPTHVTESRIGYYGSTCEEKNHFMEIRNGFALVPDDNVKHSFLATMDTAEAIIWDLQVMDGFTCEEPFPVGEVVDVMKTNCKDPSGDDFFDDAKRMFGRTINVDLEWNEEGLIDGTEVHKRISDSGCNAQL